MKLRLRRKSEKGSAAVEAALAIGVLIVLVSGLIDVGQAVINRSRLTDAIYEGVRLGVWYPGLSASSQTDLHKVGSSSYQGHKAIHDRVERIAITELELRITNLSITSQLAGDILTVSSTADSVGLFGNDAISISVSLAGDYMQ